MTKKTTTNSSPTTEAAVVTKTVEVVVAKKSDTTFEPKIVGVVKHRVKSMDTFEHLAIVQIRKPEKVQRNGGGQFAAWAVLVVNGKERSELEGFETFSTKEEAVYHAKYRANKRP